MPLARGTSYGRHSALHGHGLTANGLAGGLGYRLLLIEIAHIRLWLFSEHLARLRSDTGRGEFVLGHSPRYFNVD